MPSPYYANVRAHLLTHLAAGHTQRSLATRMGLTLTAVNSWVTGRNGPDLDSLVLLARALNLSLDTLLLTTVSMPTPTHRPPTPDRLAVNKPAPKRQMRDHRPPSPAELRDVARSVPFQSVVPSPPRRPLGSGGYSGAVVAVFGLEATQRLVRD